MKQNRLIYLLTVLIAVFLLECGLYIAGSLKSQMNAKDSQIASLKVKLSQKDVGILDLQRQVDVLKGDIGLLSNQIQKNREELDNKVSRGDVETRRMEVTAYNESEPCCGKKMSDPLYGITASGEPVKRWYTCAAGPEYKFGTRLYIPFFRNEPNKGVFTVTDRGVKDGCIDVYLKDYDACKIFGRRTLEVQILK